MAPSEVTDLVLSALPLSLVVGVVVAAGLALISVAFVSYIFRIATSAANGRLGEDDDERDREED